MANADRIPYRSPHRRRRIHSPPSAAISPSSSHGECQSSRASGGAAAAAAAWAAATSAGSWAISVSATSRPPVRAGQPIEDAVVAPRIGPLAIDAADQRPFVRLADGRPVPAGLDVDAQQARAGRPAPAR